MFSSSDFIKELDSFFAREDVAGARSFLLGAYAEQKALGDGSALITILNELVGLVRQTGEKDAAMSYIAECVELTEKIPLDAKTRGTVLLNCATTMKAFDESARAMRYYEQASQYLTRSLPSDDPLIAGLYNNTALALADLGRYEEAERYYLRAIDITSGSEKTALELAVTCCNLAQVRFERDMLDPSADALLDRAFNILSDKKYESFAKYAFTCRKCAWAFGYLGRIADERFLNERADEIYERA